MFRGFPALAGILFLVSACAIAVPDHCKKGAAALVDTRRRQQELLAQFEPPHYAFLGSRFTVFTPRGAGSPRTGPPIILLHEMPALSPDLLDLALRLSRNNYSVYVPLLWGKEDENAASRFVFFRHAFELRASSRWRAGIADVHRPILDDLAELCRKIIVEHPNQRIGVIGNCLTGIFPFALAARVPEVAAPIASQPTLPLTLSKSDWPKTGLSSEDTRRLQERIRTEPNFQLLGFRFEEDLVSPAARFDTLKRQFHPRFVDGTIPVKYYHCRDEMPRHPHAVLTECHMENPKLATSHAWQECLNFLAAKLRSDKARWYSFQEY
jgi:dienelactone hydrolase